MSEEMELTDLEPHPVDEWERMLRFVGLNGEDKAAMVAGVEALLRAAPRLVQDTYNYLQSVPETAAVLGWENGFDLEHLRERRRFFAVWVARTIGLDLSTNFAMYLFRAGKLHAAHGPRHIHVPEAYVTGSMGLVQATFASAIASEINDPALVARAMAGWAKYLNVQLNQMTMGYRVARTLESGAVPVRVSLFGRLRPLAGFDEITVRTGEPANVSDVLCKFFNYVPQTRGEALDRIWREAPPRHLDSLWMEVVPVFTPRTNWRVQLNGRGVQYENGLYTPVHTGDEVALFPPGR
jgi:molybdopterin converting factor small subunit